MRESIFARGVTSKPEVPGGRGIGLALVRLVSAQLGGSVDVSDGEDGGAVFDVRLPRLASGERTPAVAAGRTDA
jgi:signal transduction histidine kinase